ncbi:hypothetical protein D3C77_225360 [compost metagenome]
MQLVDVPFQVQQYKTEQRPALVSPERFGNCVLLRLCWLPGMQALIEHPAQAVFQYRRGAGTLHLFQALDPSCKLLRALGIPLLTQAGKQSTPQLNAERIQIEPLLQILMIFDNTPRPPVPDNLLLFEQNRLQCVNLNHSTWQCKKQKLNLL